MTNFRRVAGIPGLRVSDSSTVIDNSFVVVVPSRGHLIASEVAAPECYCPGPAKPISHLQPAKGVVLWFVRWANGMVAVVGANEGKVPSFATLYRLATQWIQHPEFTDGSNKE